MKMKNKDRLTAKKKKKCIMQKIEAGQHFF